MASLAGGAGNADWAGLGAAPGCWLISSSFVGLQPDSDYGQTGISVQNHSYGIDIHNKYDERAAAYDQSVLDFPYLLHVISAGNKGDSAAVDGPYAGIQGYGNLSGAFKMAKNVLLVGSVDSFSVPALKSSKGPAYDGRIKPDLMAFGKGGSSESAALTSGVAAVVQQVLLEKTDTLPYADLVKAILINSADDIGTPGPDFETGFGQLNALSAVEHAIGQTYTTDVIHANQTLVVPVQVSQPSNALKATLAWNDPLGALFATKALQHNLDLRLISPSGQVILPWILNTTPIRDSLSLPARRGIDTLNNIEQIVVPLPESGEWKLQIIAPPELLQAQHVALAWCLDTLHHFHWSFPLKNVPATPGSNVVLQWQSNDTLSVGAIQWRSINSPQWIDITDEAPLKKGWIRWTLPNTTEPLQLSMNVADQMYFSDTFLVHPESRIKLGFNCPDSVMLFWNSLGSAVKYQIYGLGGTTMEPLFTTADTFVVLKKNSFPQARFSVRPIWLPLELTGARSAAPDIFSQGVACYIKQFDAEWLGGPAIDLKLSLGTDYSIAKITLEKQTGSGFIALFDQFAAGTDYFWQDSNPTPGINTYRVRLDFENGLSMVSDVVHGYFSSNNKWWIFPNPATVGGNINLITLTEENTFIQIYNGNGKLVLTRELENHFTEMPLEGLGKGLYLVKVLDGSQQIGAIKLIIL
ncbi:MAG TPA: S8/S53 family peptidase [Saprospiraceae bacterium]|nr:S8/S53 family peptidase [Saprospiraceae bacterium]